MGRSLIFIKLDNESIQTLLNQKLSNDNYIKEKLFRDIEAYNISKSTKIDFEDVIDKITHDPDSLTPQEVNILYHWTYYVICSIHDRAFMQSQIPYAMECHGFEVFFHKYKSALSEMILQELWNFFDPLNQRKSFIADYIYSQQQCYGFISYLCILSAVYNARNFDNYEAHQYLEKDKTDYIHRASLRYDYMKQKHKYLEQRGTMKEFYQENKSVLDIIGHYDVFSNYHLLGQAFSKLIELKEKISHMNPESRIYIHDSLE